MTGTVPVEGASGRPSAGPPPPPLRFSYRDGTEIAVNVADRAVLMAEVRARLSRGAGFALATINLDHLVKLRRSAAFRRIYQAQDLVVADGNPVVWLARLAGREVGLIPGSDMVVPLARAAAETGRKVALLGATPEALAGAAAALRAAVPGLTIAAALAPPFGFDPEGADADALLDEAAAAGAELCLIALGAPKQETLAARGRARHPHIGFASIGAGLDFLAGTQRRAPRWVRRLALEWAWRMLGDPRRLAGRYAACALILPAEARAAIAQRSRG